MKKHDDQAEVAATPIGIEKPAPTWTLADFKSVRNEEKAEITKEPTPLPVIRAPHVNDFVRLHEDTENYWSDELSFVTVPVKGEKTGTLHLILPNIARLLPPKKVEHSRLALASKPFDEFFLCRVPTRGIETSAWAMSEALACEEVTTRWAIVYSLRSEGIERYGTRHADDNEFVPPPKWPTQSLQEIITITFGDGSHTSNIITDSEHPGLSRLLGRKVNS
jgi:hypothetical protein